MAELSSQAVSALLKEIRDIMKTPLEGITLNINEETLSVIEFSVKGPEDTPFVGGDFFVKLCYGADYPSSPPKGYFLTKIFHPNIMPETGEICVNALKRDWSPDLGLKHILMVIRCLLIQPNPESALNEDAGKLLLEDYEEYAKHARLMTSIHAAPKTVAPVEGTVEKKRKVDKKKVDKKKSIRRL
eukprot:GCRY01002988.1.p1 GENE.GCRY01002988.1~~GCRY01002988.1.p1  ORF type:complete len:186 (+),score=40.88 GCRY01002988.1:151-708(+)